MGTKPLEGIRVVELGTYVAVPSCGRMLAQLGAEVIKLEPLEGVPYRKIGHMTRNESVVFDMLNMEKKSVSIDAKSAVGNEYVLKLMSTADIFITNMRDKSLERMGLSYDALKDKNPKLVYAHFSGYGPKGALKDLPGYDTTAFFARFGILRDFVDPERPPASLMPGLGDIASGLALAMNISLALVKARERGEGELIECSLNQVATWMMLMPMLYAQYGTSYARKDGEPPVTGSNATVRCADNEYVLYACGTIQQCHSLFKAIGLDYLITDSRCKTLEEFDRNTPELFKEIELAFLKHGADQWVEILRANDIACERHRHTWEIATDEQLVANGYIQPADYVNNDIMVPIPPIGFSSVTLAATEKGPSLGQHTEEVLKTLGCSQEQFENMQRDGVIVAAPK